MSNTLGEANYRNFAERYAATIRNHPVRLYYEQPAAFELVGQIQPGLRVLDAGCGGGDYTLAMLEQGANVTAFDLMQDFVEITRQRTHHYNAPIYQADLAEPLTFAKDGSFDLVTCFLAMHYVEDWRPTLSEFYRVLDRGGSLIFSVMHPMTDTDKVNYFQRGVYETVWDNFGDPKPVIRMIHRPMMAILNAVIEAGFDIEKVLEPLPLPELEQASPLEYGHLIEKPIFLFVKARKR